MIIDKPGFYDVIREKLFGGSLSSAQVQGIESIIDYYRLEYGAAGVRPLSYILATAYHETGKLMQPVREGFAKTNVGAVAAVTKLFQEGKISTNYALPINGRSYYGRGLVQITWLDNYKRVGKLIGKDLVNQPDLALDLQISVKILVDGSIKGWFCGKKLSDYINATTTSYIGARRVINGTDKAKSIAKFAEAFEAALTVPL